MTLSLTEADCDGLRRLWDDSEALGHGVVQEPLARSVGLDPFAIDHELGDGALAGALDDLLQGTGIGFYIDLIVGNVVLGQKALGLAAIGTPGGRIDG